MPTEAPSRLAEAPVELAMGGRLRLRQPRRGYRYSVDALLLADFAAPASGRVLDLGTGCGVVLLALARASPQLEHGVGLEVQPELAELARENLGLNHLGVALRVEEGDWRSFEPRPEERFDVVVANPPYHPVGPTEPSGNRIKAIARHEVLGDLADMVQAARRSMAPGARLCVVYPMRHRARLESALAAEELVPTRWRQVHPYERDPAELVLLEAAHGAGGVSGAGELPRLVLHREDGSATPEAQRITGVGGTCLQAQRPVEPNPPLPREV